MKKRKTTKKKCHKEHWTTSNRIIFLNFPKFLLITAALGALDARIKNNEPIQEWNAQQMENEATAEPSHLNLLCSLSTTGGGVLHVLQLPETKCHSL
jgi:hypothetical protein